MPWAWDVQRLDAAMRRDRAYLKKETRRVAGFLRIIICWFFESECLIENVVMNGREDIEIAGCPANIFLDFPCPFGVGSTFVKHPPVRRGLCLRRCVSKFSTCVKSHPCVMRCISPSFIFFKNFHLSPQFWWGEVWEEGCNFSMDVMVGEVAVGWMYSYYRIGLWGDIKSAGWYPRNDDMEKRNTKPLILNKESGGSCGDICVIVKFNSKYKI